MVKLPKFPLEYGGERSYKRNDPPEIGADTQEILKSIAYTENKIEELRKDNTIC